MTTKQLKATKYRLRCASGYAGTDASKIGYPAAIVSEHQAYVFDGRDNEDHKIRYYSAVLKTPFWVEYISLSA